MNEQTRTNQELIEENGLLKQRILKLEKSEAGSKWAEEVLREERWRLQSIIEGTRVGTWEWNIQTGETVFNETWAEIVGYTLDELSPLSIKTWEALAHPEDLKQSGELLERHFSGVLPYYDCESRMKHKDGNWVWVQDRGRIITRTADGKPLMMFGTHTDITERKRTEELLREREEKYRTLLETMEEGYFEDDLQGNFTFVNDSMCRLFGLSREEILGLNGRDFLDPEVQRGAAENFMKVYNTGQPGKLLEWELRRIDGKKYTLESSIYLVRDAQGEPVGFRGIARDITERKQMEAALREREERYRTLLETMEEGYFEVDLKGDYTFVNESLCKIHGASRDELLGLNYKDYMEEGTAKKVRTVFLQVYNTGVPVRLFEWEIIKSDGTRTVEESSIYLMRNSQGAPIGFRGIERDITNRRGAEEALRESEGRFRFLAENMADIVWTADLSLRNTYASPSVEKILGFTPEEWKKLSLEEMVTPESLKRIQSKLQEEFQREKEVLSDPDRSITMEVEYYRKDGSTVLMENIVKGIRDHRGSIVGIHGVSRDITDRKRAEEERRKLEAQLWQARKTESLGRMAGAIAHHFNNQLGVVTGNLELAMIDLPSGAEVRGRLAKAMNASHQAAELSSLMLTYLGQMTGEREPLDLSAVCLRSLPILQAAIPKTVVLDHNLPTPGPIVSANANQIQQVLTNLITNAWEAVGDDQGVIHLTVKTVSSADIPTSHRFPINWQPDHNAYACLEVTDTGCGIPEKDMEKLFDPFFSTKFTGRGLGLPAVLGIVRRHGGVVTLESEPGRGSVFQVFFPMSAEEVLRQPEKAAQTPEIKEGGTVLLIEDEEMVREMAQTMLRRLGFTVFSARDGVEAVEVFRDHQAEIHCVLCDLTMPRLNGWETLAVLRELRPGVPVILASGYDESKVMEGKQAEFPQVFLKKPYSMLELKAALGAAMGGYRLPKG